MDIKAQILSLYQKLPVSERRAVVYLLVANLSLSFFELVSVLFISKGLSMLLGIESGPFESFLIDEDSFIYFFAGSIVVLILLRLCVLRGNALWAFTTAGCISDCIARLILHAKGNVLDEYKIGELKSLLWEVPGNISFQVIIPLLNFIYLLSTFVLLVLALVYQFGITMDLLATIFIFFLGFLLLIRFIRTRGGDIGENISDLITVIDELVDGLVEIKANKLDIEALDKFSSMCFTLRHLQGQILFVGALPKLFLEASVLALVIFLVFVQSSLNLAPGAFVFFGVASLRIAPILGGLFQSLNGIRSYWYQLERFNSVASEFELHSVGNYGAGSSTGSPRLNVGVVPLTLNCVGLSVKRGDKLLFERVSFEASSGQVVKVFGGNGAGKSSLFQVLIGYREPVRGSVEYNRLLGGDSVDQDSVSIGLVCQHPTFFQGSIAQNLFRKGELDNFELQLFEVLKIKLGFPSHFCSVDCMIEYGGRNLSGGERQRLALARLLIRSPDVALLDEAFSAIDAKSRSSIQDFVLHELESKIVLCIDHFDEIKRVDKVISLV